MVNAIVFKAGRVLFIDIRENFDLILGDELLGHAFDVFALIAVLRKFHSTSEQFNGPAFDRFSQKVDLVAAIVDVIFPAGLKSYKVEDIGQRVTDRGLAGVGDAQWPRRVGADKFHLDHFILSMCGTAVVVPFFKYLADDLVKGFGGSGKN